MSSSKSKSATKDASASKKDDRYENMLKKIDIGLDKEKSKKPFDDNDADGDDDGFITDSRNKSKSGGVSLMDLVSNLQSNDKATGNSSLLKSHLADLTLKNTFKEAPSARKQEELERKANYAVVKKDVQKWQGIIKKNREAPHLDLTQKHDDKISINNNRKGITKTALENKLDSKLKELNLFQESDVLNEEKEMLKKLNPDEAKRRQSEIAKFKNLMFYKELKNKRVSKIKSRLFHKIKKKRELRMQQKLLDGASENDPTLQLKELEELEKKRAEERIGMRHKNKSKYAKNILRYGNEKDAQQSVNDIAQFRKELMKKINADQKEVLEAQLRGEGDDELNDQEFRDKLIDEVEDQLKLADEEEETQPTDGKKKKLPGFMQRLKDQQKKDSRREAEELLEKLKSTNNLDDFELSDEDEVKEGEDEDEEAAEERKKKKKEKEDKKKDGIFTGRKKFHKDTAKPTTIEVEDYKKAQKSLKTQDILKTYINNQDEQPQIGITTGVSEDKASGNLASETGKTTHFDRLEPKDLTVLQEEKNTEQDSSARKNNKKSGSKGKDELNTMVEEKTANTQDGDESAKAKASGKKSKNNSTNKDELVSGLNFGGLKQKYTKGPNNEFLNDEIEKFNEENKQDIYNDLANFNIVTSNIYNEDFAQEKQKLLEEELPPEPKQIKGWGSWTGLGIKEKKVDPQVQLQQKVKRINDLQKKRQDGKLENVIINDARDKSVAKYLVRDLPHPYRSADQFDYIQNIALGPETNTMRNFQRLNKSKVITKVGEIINPIKMAKKPGKQQIH